MSLYLTHLALMHHLIGNARDR